MGRGTGAVCMCGKGSVERGEVRARGLDDALLLDTTQCSDHVWDLGAEQLDPMGAMSTNRMTWNSRVGGAAPPDEKGCGRDSSVPGLRSSPRFSGFAAWAAGWGQGTRSDGVRSCDEELDEDDWNSRGDEEALIWFSSSSEHSSGHPRRMLCTHRWCLEQNWGGLVCFLLSSSTVFEAPPRCCCCCCPPSLESLLFSSRRKLFLDASHAGSLLLLRTSRWRSHGGLPSPNLGRDELPHRGVSETSELSVRFLFSGDAEILAGWQAATSDEAADIFRSRKDPTSEFKNG